MKNVKGNAIIGQSGGPTSAINATLAGVFKAARDNEYIETVYGMVHGIQGLLDGDMVDMGEKLKTDCDIDLLASTPSAYLGSCRYKLSQEDYDKVFEVIEKHNIKYFFYIGGNDSMDTVYQLSRYAEKTGHEINIMGVPKTIDNDLFGTDHAPGFGSAAKYIASSVREVCRDASVYSAKCVTIFEIMGRNSGWLTASSALAKGNGCDAPDLIYLPEVMFSIDKFIEDIRKVSENKKCITVAVSEGIRVDKHTYVCETMGGNETDAFGHKRLGGTGTVLANIVAEKLGFKTRQIEFSLLQRCAAHIASKTDIDESLMIGKKAVEEAVAGSTGKMVCYIRESDSPYKISIGSLDISEIANVEKLVPREWINEDGNYVTQECIDYMFPLIQGEAKIYMKDGLPEHAVL